MKVALFAPPGLFADGLRPLLSKLGTEVAIERHAPDARAVACAECDLAVVDVDAVSPRNPAAAVTKLLGLLPNTPLVAVAERLDEQAVAAVMQAGAVGYIAKSFGKDQALGVLRLVIEKAGVRPPQNAESSTPQDSHTGTQPPVGRNGRPYGLTQREMEVLALLIVGMANKQIGNRLGITEGVVRLHLHHAYEKLGVRSRTQALPLAQQIDEIRRIQIEGVGDAASLQQWLLPHMSPESKRKGEVLFRKGDPGKALYFIEAGQVRLLEIDKVLGEGALLGEIGIFAPDNRRTCSARCETAARLRSLAAARAQYLFFANPQFAYYLTRLIAQRLLSGQAAALQTARA